MALLDPIVDEIVAKQHPELKNNLPLARGILDNALRATIQLSKLDRTPVVLSCYKELATGRRRRRRGGRGAQTAGGVYPAATGGIEAQEGRRRL